MQKAAQALEWGRFLELAEAQARTERGKSLLRELVHSEHWAPNLSASRLMQQETQEAAHILDRDALLGPSGRFDPPFSTDRPPGARIRA